MDTAAQVLLIIVSTVLVIFLLAMIGVAYYFINVMRSIKRIAGKAENAASVVEAAADTFKKAATPIAILKVAGNIYKRVKNKE